YPRDCAVTRVENDLADRGKLSVHRSVPFHTPDAISCSWKPCGSLKNYNTTTLIRKQRHHRFIQPRGKLRFKATVFVKLGEKLRGMPFAFVKAPPTKMLPSASTERALTNGPLDTGRSTAASKPLSKVPSDSNLARPLLAV